MFKYLILLLFVVSCEHTNTIEIQQEPLTFLGCPETKIIEFKHYPISSTDLRNMEIAKERCGRLFMDSPCLKVFKIISYLNYQATCGEPVEVRRE